MRRLERGGRYGVRSGVGVHRVGGRMTNSDIVPVDQRWLGLDKRALPYALVAVVLIAVLAWVVPAINGAIEWSDETEAGDLIDLGGGIVFTPPTGWLLEDGLRTTDDPAVPADPARAAATVATGGLTTSVTGSRWDGDANALLDQVNTLRKNSDEDDDKLFKVAGDRSTLATLAGVVGVAEPFTSATGDGAMYAFVIDRGDDPPIGVVFSATGTEQAMAQFGNDVEQMVASLTYTEPVS
jgi:hypothetical protein